MQLNKYGWPKNKIRIQEPKILYAKNVYFMPNFFWRKIYLCIDLFIYVFLESSSSAWASFILRPLVLCHPLLFRGLDCLHHFAVPPHFHTRLLLAATSLQEARPRFGKAI